VPVIANPARLWGTPQETAAAPPLLGQHTREILAELAGYDEALVSALIEQGVIGTLG
jgi:crotonobetainyl-CoA:carnitine CoA-transferase CaiB-like acyl-CoA transferase